MRLTSSRAYNRPPAVPTMPPGLVDLMDGLARDVLKHNPSNVYEFCAKHMEKLLEIRDGSSAKKMITVEQKIQKAQEKMRQKAQERREKFDQSLILRSDNDIAGHGERDTQLIVENLAAPSPSFKAPIHHEVDLDTVSEVEISLASQIKNEVSTDEIVHNIDDSKYATTVHLEGLKIPDMEIESNDGLGQGNDTECIKKIEDESIFGEMENENIFINVEPLKETNQEEIDLAVADSPLQTITEASEENLVTDPVILPKITIGDDHDIIPEEQHYTAQLGKNDGLTDYVTAEENLQKSLDKSDKNNKSKSDDTYLTVTQNDAITHENDQDQIKMTTDLDGNTENIHEIELNTKQLKDDDSSEISLTLLKPEDSGKVVVDLVVSDEIHNNSIVMSHTGDPNFVGSSSVHVLNESDHKESIIELHETDDKMFIKSSLNDSEIENISKPNQVILNTDADQVKTDKASKTETDVKATENITDNEMNTELAVEEKHVNVNVTTNDDVEMKSDIETDNMISDINRSDPNFKEVVTVENNDTVSNVTNIDAVKIESEIVGSEQGTEKESVANLDDKNNDNTEISLLKSDSTENTNEDSLSMVESDLSRTEENPNMDLETAAVTIQKVFRSFMFKSRNSTFEDPTNDEHNSVDEDNDKKEEYYAAANLNKDRRTLGITRMDTVLQTVNEEKSLSLSTDDSSTLSSAATTIQAHVRGFLVRNRLNSSKTYSMNSLVNSHEVLEAETEQHKNKTILNIHIVPEEGNYLSRDESLITSMDLSLDGSPPSSVNLHPLSCDISERRKMLKREDAVQSVSPPSNNSGKLSEDSVKEILINDNGILERDLSDDKTIEIDDPMKEFDNEASEIISSASTVTPTTIITISKSEDPVGSPRDDTETGLRRNGKSLTKLSSDESDVITPFVPSPRSSEDGTNLVHSGEFHDVVLPTKVSRNDTSAVRGE